MRVIDLLNRIANGEVIGKNKINIDNNVITIDTLLGSYIFDKNRLNDKVEIIEEKEMCHKCGKYPAEYNQTYCEFCLGISEEDKKIEKLNIYNYTEHDIMTKVNEIIDYINGSGKE